MNKTPNPKFAIIQLSLSIAHTVPAQYWRGRILPENAADASRSNSFNE